MLRCHIVVTLWTLATTVIATPPSDNVGQIARINENQPEYLYKYSIENEDKARQDKIETRSDELVNGQYYINNNQSSTDVKYFADEWGYHPVVQYTTSDDHNSANSAHLAIDNHPIYESYNKTTNTGNEIKISNIHSLESSLPSIVPNANVYQQSVNNIDLTNGGVLKRDESTESPSQYSTVINLLNKNNSVQQDEMINNYSISDLNSEETGDESSPITENILLKETAGIFGQRIQQYITQQLNTTSQTDLELSDTTRPLANENKLEIHPETSSSNYKRALENLRKYLGFHSANKFESHNEDEKNPQIEQPVLLNDTNISYINSLGNIKTIASDEITSLNGRFSRPIVVAEISNTEQLNYSNTVPCYGDDGKLISSSTISVDTLPCVDTNVGKTSVTQITRIEAVTPRLQQPPYVTTSSMVLNPIQAGLALVNAGGADLIVGNVEPSVTATVNENRFNENASIDTSQPLKNIKHDATSQSLNIPPTINPTFGEYEMSTKTSQLSLVDDEGVEIQKSLELYHSSPVHEIHYPAQLTPQVTSIDQQQRQEPYQTTQKHENAKQTFERNVESYEKDIGLTTRNSNTLKYQSIVNPSTLPLQELQTTPKGNDPTLVRIMDNEKNVYDNNVEHFKRPLENYDSQDDHLSLSAMQENLSNVENSFSNTGLNSELYLPYDTKNVYHIVEPNESNNNVNDKSMKEKSKSDITMELHPRTQSILQRLLSESSDVVHHLEVDKLNNHDKHLHQRHPQSANELRIASGPDYTKAEINLTQRQIPIFTSEQYIDATSIIDNTIPLIQSQTPAAAPAELTKNNQVSSDIDNNTIYIYTPKINNEINKIRDYGQLLKNPVGKYFDDSVNRQSAIRPFSYPVNSNGILEKHVPYALQPYPIASAEKIIEKKMVPYPIHKFVAQPYPIHIVQPYTVEKSTKIPAITYQNIVTKNGHIPHGYPVEIPIKISYPVELTKHIGKKIIPIPYGMQYGLNYQHLLDQHSHKLYNKHGVNSVDSKFSANMSNQNNQGYIYINPVIPFVNLPPALSKRYGSLNQFTNSKQYYPRQQSLHYQPSSKNLHPSYLPFQTHTTINIDHQTPLRWHVTHHDDEKFMNKNTEYLGPVPVLAQHALNVHQQNQVVHPAHQETFQYSTGAPIAAGFSLKRLKLPEMHYRGNTGNFRQSKMEYGFKPPMIPSIQYDEQTAMKVEN